MHTMMDKAQQSMYEFTSTGRTLDPRYPTNLAIMVFTPLAGIIAGILSLLAGETFNEAIRAGFFTGASTFLAWALAREFDPDHELAAFLGAFLAFAASLFAAPPSIWPLGAMIVLARIVNRTVGPPAKIGDGIASLIFTGLAIISGWWVFGIVAAAAYVLDVVLPTPNRKMGVFAALALIGMFVFIIVNQASKPYAEFTWWPVVLVASLGIAWVIFNTKVYAPCDIPTYRLTTLRVQATMGMMLFAGIIFALWAGNAGVIALLPLWMMMVGISGWRIWEIAKA